MKPIRQTHTSRSSLLRALAMTCSLLAVGLSTETRTGAIPSSTGKQFLYWWNHHVVSETADHVSIVHRLDSDPSTVANWLQTLDPNVKAAVHVEWVLHEYPNTCNLAPTWQTKWSNLSAAIAPYLSKIAVFAIADELDLSAGHCHPGDPNGLTYVMNEVEQMSSIVKATFPGVKTWVNYGDQFRNAPVVAQNIDWTSFDCYGPFENCFGTGLSIPQLVDNLASKLPNPQTQSIFLVTDASCFLYNGTGRRVHESELFVRALQYWQLAVTHPRISGMIGFQWDSGTCTYYSPPDTINGINDSPGLSTLYRYIGRNLLLGEVPLISTLSAPGGCVIPSGGGACTVNLGWTRTSGPNVGAFARLAGQMDPAYPLCPGATACSVPTGPGDYIVELRENYWDANSKLLWAQTVEVRHGSGAPTGQITFTTPGCKLDQTGNCLGVLTANVQNAPAAAFFVVGSPYALCGAGRASFCGINGGAVGVGLHSVTVQLRANAADPNSALLDQRQIQVRICASTDSTCTF